MGGLLKTACMANGLDLVTIFLPLLEISIFCLERQPRLRVEGLFSDSFCKKPNSVPLQVRGKASHLGTSRHGKTVTKFTVQKPSLRGYISERESFALENKKNKSKNAKLDRGHSSPCRKPY